MFCSRCGTEVQENGKFCPSCGLDLGTQTPLGRVTTSDTAEKTEADLVGEALAEEYELLQELGRGGMAIVYRARDKHLDREVAIKVLPFSLAFDAEFVERFQREARTSARLEHPNIIPIYRVGKSGRVIFFVMKFLRGQSLSEVIEQKGTVPPEDIRRLLIQTASGLGYAHKHGIVHRDMKPDNIMYDELGHAIVTDFGIAKAASGTRLTGTGMSIGTPHYMSPEQARAQSLDGRSDIYSLGVVGYQCLTGRVPFDGEDAFSIGYKHIMEELEEPPLQSGEQRQVFQVIRRMMAKSPDDRYQSAEDLVAELEHGTAAARDRSADVASAPTVALSAVERQQAAAASGHVDRQPTSQAERPSTPTTPMPRAEPLPPPPERRKKRRGGLVAASLVVLLGGGGYGGYWYYTNHVQTVGLVSNPMLDTTLASTTPPDSLLRALADSLTLSDSAGVADTAGAARVRPALPDSGWVIVRGAPHGASFGVDGTTYNRNTIRVEMGSHRVVVEADGYEPQSEFVSVGRGDTARLSVSLERVEPEQAAEPEPSPPPRPRPTAQCATPTQNNYNLNRGCFDVLPRLLGDPSVPLDASVGADPTQVILWVRVRASGKADSRSPARPSSDAGFTLLAMQYALTQSYQPATLNGQPVDAWFQVVFRPARRQ